MSKLSYQIEKYIGVISETSGGWSKELNLISWNDRKAKYDIRDWDPDHDKMGKGITLTREELEALSEIINDYLSSH